MQHAADVMIYAERVGAQHRAVVRGKPRTRRHWLAVLRCPVCGAERQQLANAYRPMTCDGATQRRVSR